MQNNQLISQTVPVKKTFRLVTILSGVIVSLLLAGCATPPPPTTLQFPTNGQTPPSGKSLVVIHRPKISQGWMQTTDIWEGRNLIVELGNGQSIAYVCEPGKHQFFNRSVEIVGTIEADLLPDKIYGLWVEPGGIWIPSFKLKPITLTDKGWWREADRVQKQNKWVTRSARSAKQENKWLKEIGPILDSITSGKRKDIQHLDAENHL